MDRAASFSVSRLRRDLLSWYDQNRRELPWRRDTDPYRVWVSEIMLQQTRVAAVLDHYSRFMKRFPTVQALASAREASVLAAWSGLGYYHRARRMHQAAKVIARERKGAFPGTAEEWLQLPGIGRYTAAAIASIAFGEAVAVVDGNVERVLQRLIGTPLSREAAWQDAEKLLDRKRPGDFNQAMMELGAVVCTPRAPQCLLCPLHSFCETRGAGLARSKEIRKTKQLYYALALQNGEVLLVKRSADESLMAGMWELPMIAVDAVNGDAPVLRLRHSITDTNYLVAVFGVLPGQVEEGRWFSRRQCERLPLTGLTRKILVRVGVL
jgi:A/G-specific adenine glycosylase